MAKDPYIPFDWPNLGSPLTPFIALKFRGFNEFYYTFPDKTNRIYIENATFATLDDTGYSTASITLVDPDFYNLETIFLKALYIANSMTRFQGNWYVAAFWGWSYYGQQVGEGDNAGQRKTSGIHYYMLKGINYNLSDVDLRVSMDLMDIGAGMLEGDEGTTIGLLNPGDGVTHSRPTSDGTGSGATGSGATGSESRTPEEVIAERWNAENPDKPFRATGRKDHLDFEPGGGGPSVTPDAEGGTQQEPSQNVITGKSYWEVIKLISAAHNVLAVPFPDDVFPPPTDGPSPGEGGGKVMSPEYGRIIIPEDELLTDALDDLILKISNQPIEATDESPTWKWNIFAGGKSSPKPKGSGVQSDLDVVWGWKPQPPKGSMNIEDYYRLARTFTYRPGAKSEIARGETLVTNINYDWTTRLGMLGLGLPPVYINAPDEEGEHTTYLTLDDFTSLNPEEVARIKSNPSVQAIPLQDLVGKLGVELKFNFDTRTESKEVIEIAANAIIINVWNEFLNDIVTITIDIAGDPWLDNQIFNSDGSASNSDLLVNLYQAYFKVKVYKLSPGSYQGGSAAFLSDILSGNYLCLKGCSHSISDGEYTTTLQLLKAP